MYVEFFVLNWLLNECESSIVSDCLLQVLHFNYGDIVVVVVVVVAATSLYIPSP